MRSLRSSVKSRKAVRRELHGAPHPVPVSDGTVLDHPEGWYRGVMLAPSTLGAQAVSPGCLREVARIIERLEADDYVRYLLTYYRSGLERFGDSWRYADIATVLRAAGLLARPKSYLEIGVRRGRSMAIVAATCPECEILGIDIWRQDYAGMPNPGPDFVRAEMTKLGHTGRLELVNGDSHRLLPKMLAERPEAYFDLVTVDGDHSERGAAQDLHDVLPRVKVGGVIVFDDICHPSHPYLAAVWQGTVAADARFATWEFTELGFGVAFAVRREA